MEITEVRIKLMEDAGDRLQAFCSITFDDAFVIRDLKIIEGTHGPFVAMPSRKLTSRCGQCGSKNHLRAAYCNQCGQKLHEDRAPRDESGRAKLYADIAHPINTGCREMIQERIIAEFYDEIERSKQPGYVSRYEDFDAGEDYVHPADVEGAGSQRESRREKDLAHESPPQPPHHASAQPEVRRAAKPALGHQPPPPHRKAPSPQPPPTTRTQRDSFGAGIF
jgi:stage V sporulation protein G